MPGMAWQRLVVEAGDAAADGDELVEAGQLDEADGGVEFAHPPGVTEADVVAAEEAGLALVAVDAGLVAQTFASAVVMIPPSPLVMTLVG